MQQRVWLVLRGFTCPVQHTLERRIPHTHLLLLVVAVLVLLVCWVYCPAMLLQGVLLLLMLKCLGPSSSSSWVCLAAVARVVQRPC